jgi:serine/threonine protein kinase
MKNLVRKLSLRNNFVDLISYSKSTDGLPGPDQELERLYIVTELGDETLDHLLKKRAKEGGALSTEEIRKLQWAMVTIVCLLHTVGFVHLDIKPVNIMSFCGVWKLVDFDGVVRTKTTMNCEHILYTPLYVSPEVARVIDRQHKGGDEKFQSSRLMDVWSVGICAMEAVFLQPILLPWFEEWEKETGDMYKFLGWLSDYDKPLMDDDMVGAMSAVDPNMSELLQSMLKKDPESRLDIAGCLVHAWFQPLREEAWDKIDRMETRKVTAEDEHRKGSQQSQASTYSFAAGKPPSQSSMKRARACTVM